MRLLSLIFAPRYSALLLSIFFFVWVLVALALDPGRHRACLPSRWRVSAA